MKPEALLVLASARGLTLNLGRPRRREIPLEHRGKPRPRSEKVTIGGEEHTVKFPGVQTADGRQYQGGGPRQWTATDLGLAAGGMGKLEWRSLCWCIGLDERSRESLHLELLERALARKEREAWPSSFRRARCHVEGCGMARCSHKYVEDLCAMALIEGANPEQPRNDAMRARLFGMDERAFRRYVSRIYQSVHGDLHNWYVNALEHLRRGLREVDERRERAQGAA